MEEIIHIKDQIVSSSLQSVQANFPDANRLTEQNGIKVEDGVAKEPTVKTERERKREASASISEE